jgi:FMN reductase|tara:strand:+ start:526 stop:1038 length:513 start_codon:yes stop_codon:yes gene_type:complete
MPNLTAVLGSPFAESSSEKIVRLIISKLHLAGWKDIIIDLSDMSSEALLLRSKDQHLDQSISDTINANLIVVASPTYRATYTGLLKSFFDQLPQDSLINKFALPIQTGGSADHALTIEYGMAPMLRSLGASILSTSIYSWGEDWTEEKKPTQSLINKINLSVEEINKLID